MLWLSLRTARRVAILYCRCWQLHLANPTATACGALTSNCWSDDRRLRVIPGGKTYNSLANLLQSVLHFSTSLLHICLHELGVGEFG